MLTVLAGGPKLTFEKDRLVLCPRMFMGVVFKHIVSDRHKSSDIFSV